MLCLWECMYMSSQVCVGIHACVWCRGVSCLTDGQRWWLGSFREMSRRKKKKDSSSMKIVKAGIEHKRILF